MTADILKKEAGDDYAVFLDLCDELEARSLASDVELSPEEMIEMDYFIDAIRQPEKGLDGEPVIGKMNGIGSLYFHASRLLAIESKLSSSVDDLIDHFPTTHKASIAVANHQFEYWSQAVERITEDRGLTPSQANGLTRQVYSLYAEDLSQAARQIERLVSIRQRLSDVTDRISPPGVWDAFTPLNASIVDQAGPLSDNAEVHVIYYGKPILGPLDSADWMGKQTELMAAAHSAFYDANPALGCDMPLASKTPEALREALKYDIACCLNDKTLDPDTREKVTALADRFYAGIGEPTLMSTYQPNGGVENGTPKL